MLPHSLHFSNRIEYFVVCNHHLLLLAAAVDFVPYKVVRQAFLQKSVFAIVTYL